LPEEDETLGDLINDSRLVWNYGQSDPPTIRAVRWIC
jgi:hypothetical protein